MQQQATRISTEQSLTLVRNLMRTSVGTICFFRGLFPDDCFNITKLSGLNIHQLVPITEESKLILDWLETGVFPAIEKRYIDQIIFSIYSPESSASENQVLLESYCFTVSYDKNGETSLQFSNSESTNPDKMKSDIKSATIGLIRTLISCSDVMKPIPEERILSMRLLYRDDFTPQNFQPTGFRETLPTETLEFPEKPIKIRVGNVKTPYHEVKVRILSTPGQFLGGGFEDCLDQSQTIQNEFKDTEPELKNTVVKPMDADDNRSQKYQTENRRQPSRQTSPELLSNSADKQQNLTLEVEEMENELKTTSLNVNIKNFETIHAYILKLTQFKLSEVCNKFPQIPKSTINEVIKNLTLENTIKKSGLYYQKIEMRAKCTVDNSEVLEFIRSKESGVFIATLMKEYKISKEAMNLILNDLDNRDLIKKASNGRYTISQAKYDTSFENLSQTKKRTSSSINIDLESQLTQPLENNEHRKESIVTEAIFQNSTKKQKLN